MSLYLVCQRSYKQLSPGSIFSSVGVCEGEEGRIQLTGLEALQKVSVVFIVKEVTLF